MPRGVARTAGSPMRKHDAATGMTLVCAGLVLGFGVGVAIAGASDPGWIWGRANCAPWSVPPTTGWIACRSCCGGAPAATAPDCLAFCAQVGWKYWLGDDPEP